MQGRLILNVVVLQRVVILEDCTQSMISIVQSLGGGRNSRLTMDLRLDAIELVGLIDLQLDDCLVKHAHENLSMQCGELPSLIPLPYHELQGSLIPKGLLPGTPHTVTQHTVVLKFLACKD